MRKIISKVVLIGSIGVGKTSLVRRFVHSKFDEEYLSTIGVKVDKFTVQSDDSEVEMLIWDLAGEIFLNNMFDKYLSGASGIIGVYDVTRPRTQHQLIEVMDKLKLSKDYSNQIILGNKIDLIENEVDQLELQKTFSYDYLTSARTGQHVKDAFYHIAKKITTSDV